MIFENIKSWLDVCENVTLRPDVTVNVKLQHNTTVNDKNDLILQWILNYDMISQWMLKIWRITMNVKKWPDNHTIDYMVIPQGFVTMLCAVRYKE